MKRYGRYLMCLVCNQDDLEDNWVYEDGSAWCPNCGELVPARKTKISRTEQKPRYPREVQEDDDSDV